MRYTSDEEGKRERKEGKKEEVKGGRGKKESWQGRAIYKHRESSGHDTQFGRLVPIGFSAVSACFGVLLSNSTCIPQLY